ncbi:hypothetical protein FOCC_FOCC004562 [Frankliniella occidentalis]|uniref:Uncharacterized protein LOC113202940 n=1 Tax=Frankliniella occidentalis TaxID=133901 RepID=A0A6J1RW28_FRAOC|nr:uncharacterized protein LOC113202940 [Frankliniella occidentalis]KAE8748759.1 hypothetical protein FOCC_FOCC004562 [Frankliniella occidentalis]
MKSFCAVALLALLAVCALGEEQDERRLPPPQNCRPPPDQCFISLQPICARQEIGYQVQYKTFSSPCDMEEYNCLYGTRYREKSSGRCRGAGAYFPGSVGEFGDEQQQDAAATAETAAPRELNASVIPN